MKGDVRSFVRGTRKLPSLPSIYYELVQIIQNSQSSVEDITRILGRDQSLTVRLLNLANSAFYGCPFEVGTLEEAVMLIGLREIQELALATSVIEAFDKVSPGLVDVTSFWEHSIACGLASSLLAEKSHDPMPERHFVGGLLHDIGRLVMFLGAPDDCAEVLRRCQAERLTAVHAETQVFGFDHAMVGAELVTLWKLPAHLARMVRCHHGPAGAVEGFSAETFIVHYADFLTAALDFGNTGEFFLSPLVVPEDCREEVLDRESLEELVEQLERQCSEVFPILAHPKKKHAATSTPSNRG